jgi:hypothetical protein
LGFAFLSQIYWQIIGKKKPHGLSNSRLFFHLLFLFLDQQKFCSRSQMLFCLPTKELNEAIKTSGPLSRLTAVYGDEAGMPKGQGLKLSTMSISEQRFDRQWQRLKKLEQKMERMNKAADQITDDKERTVLECILDGVRMNMVSRHVGISRQRLNEIKRLLVKKMAWVLYENEL